MNRHIALLLVAFLPDCTESTSMSHLAIRSEMENMIIVTELRGVGFAPFPDANASTNSVIIGAVSKARSAHGERCKIIVHDTITLTYRDPDGSVHSPRVSIIGKVPGKNDYGEVEIIVSGPNEATVFIME